MTDHLNHPSPPQGYLFPSHVDRFNHGTLLKIWLRTVPIWINASGVSDEMYRHLDSNIFP